MTSTAAGDGPAAQSAYVHIPFCRSRCHYCDFPIVPVGSGASPRAVALAERYVEALRREVRAAAAAVPRARGRAAPLRTVSFGGGTPSLLPPAALGLILRELDSAFGIADDAEISLEADPGTFDADKLAAWREYGVSRLSIGVQSFDDELLRAAGRQHDVAGAREALALVRASGMPSWSLDVISGLPQLTQERWETTLRAAVAESPDHVSVYDLQVEEGTAFARWYEDGVSPLPSPGTAADMYRAAAHILRGAGYEHYEVSNFARPGHRSRHNLVYWRNEPFYAFGNGAASYLGGVRYSRPRELEEYFEYVNAVESGARAYGAADDEPAADDVALIDDDDDDQEALCDALMLGLRLADGVDLRALRAQHGAAALAPLQAPLRQLVEDGLAEVYGDTEQGGDERALAAGWDYGEVRRVRLSDPEGFLLSNAAISTLFAAVA